MFNVAGLTSEQAATQLAEHEVAVWHGNYYAHELELSRPRARRRGPRRLRALQRREDVDRLLEAVASL